MTGEKTDFISEIDTTFVDDQLQDALTPNSQLESGMIEEED